VAVKEAQYLQKQNFYRKKVRTVDEVMKQIKKDEVEEEEEELKEDEAQLLDEQEDEFEISGADRDVLNTRIISLFGIVQSLCASPTQAKLKMLENLVSLRKTNFQ